MFLNEVYPLNTTTGKLMIEIHLEQYIYLFNEWDNASFKRRDLDPDLIYFLEECSQEIPLKHDIELNITITEEKRDLIKEKNIIKGFRNQYIHYLRLEKRNLKELFMRALLYVVTAFALIFTASMLEGTLKEHPVSTTLLEGFYVGGWVFAWEAISSFSFHSGSLRRKIKEYKRFLRAPIHFIYKDKTM
ncbi:hypothetical protein TZ02_00975 [Clostridium aceticum]|nr:hypothetical protein TZ02_00975 [Clostridium aceticum]